MLRSALIAVALVAALVAAGVIAVAGGTPALSTGGPTSVTGTEGSGVFQVAERTVRQVRYADGGTLTYTFSVTNGGRLPVALRLADDQAQPRLFTYSGLTDADGADTVRLGPGETAPVTLSLLMDGCETLSARAGSFATEVAVEATQLGVLSDRVVLTLPEEVHTGSPREAFCPGATATSRPAG